MQEYKGRAGNQVVRTDVRESKNRLKVRNLRMQNYLWRSGEEW